MGMDAVLLKGLIGCASNAHEQHQQSVGVARTSAEVIQAWRLVYQTYRRSGLIPPNEHEIYTLKQALNGRAAVVVSLCGSSVVSTLSSCHDGPAGLPLDASCGRAMDRLRQQRRHLVEVGLLSDASSSGRRSISELLHLMRYAYFYGLHTGGTDIVIGVHPRHARFYQRSLGFEPFDRITRCARVNDHPMVPLRLELTAGLADAGLPRGLAYFRDHRVEPEAYRSALRMEPRTFAGTVVQRFLDAVGKEEAFSSKRAAHASPVPAAPTAAPDVQAA